MDNPQATIEADRRWLRQRLNTGHVITLAEYTTESPWCQARYKREASSSADLGITLYALSVATLLFPVGPLTTR